MMGKQVYIFTAMVRVSIEARGETTEEAKAAAAGLIPRLEGADYWPGNSSASAVIVFSEIDGDFDNSTDGTF
jgi:hypothetical protein